MDNPVTSIAVIVSTLSLIYFLFSRQYNYWTDRHIPGPRPFFPLGTITQYIGNAIFKVEDALAKKYGKLVGMYDASQPVLLVTDPAVIRECLISKFSSFVDANQFAFGNLVDDILVFKSGDDWRRTRQLMAPHFSPLKLRDVYDVIESCSHRLIDYLGSSIEEGRSEVDVQDFAASFTLQAIGKVAFATDFDTYPSTKNHQISSQDEEFVRHAKNLTGKVSKLAFLGILLFPRWLSKWLWLSPFDYDATRYIEKLCQEIARRHMDLSSSTQSKIKITTANFVQMMTESKKLSQKEVESQTAVIFTAGYETSQALLIFIHYMLALHPDIQEKLRQELKDINDQERLLKNDYLDAFVNEVLRIYPPLVKYDRIASEDVTIESTQIPLSIKKGTVIRVPVWHMHHNPEYFPDPETFNPDRFLKENIDQIDSCTFTPFVIGPRNCLGKHLALMEAKCVTAHLLRNFRIRKSEKTPIPMTYATSTIILKAKNVQVVFEKLD